MKVESLPELKVQQSEPRQGGVIGRCMPALLLVVRVLAGVFSEPFSAGGCLESAGDCATPIREFIGHFVCAVSARIVRSSHGELHAAAGAGGADLFAEQQGVRGGDDWRDHLNGWVDLDLCAACGSCGREWFGVLLFWVSRASAIFKRAGNGGAGERRIIAFARDRPEARADFGGGFVGKPFGRLISAS